MVLDTLMRAAGVMVVLDLPEDMLEMRLADEDEVVEGFPGFADESFRKGVAVGRLKWSFDDLDGLGLEDFIQGLKRRVVVVDQILDPGLVGVDYQKEIPGLLADPFGVGGEGAAGDMDSARLEVDEEQDVEGGEAAECPDFIGEEVGRPGCGQMTLDKGFPGHAFAVGGGGQAVFPEFEYGFGLEDERGLREAVFGFKAGLGESGALFVGKENAFVTNDFEERPDLCFEKLDFGALFVAEHGANALDELVNGCDVVSAIHKAAEDRRLCEADED
jgi:hypothetical protein